MTQRAPNRLLRVNLAEEWVESECVPERWLKRYLGGKGLGARYLYEELDPSVDPLSPANRLLLMLGPLAGAAPHEQRYAAVTKSPLTNGFLDSYSGGAFPARLAGSLPDYVGVVIQGRADDPVVLHLRDGDADLRPAADYWGLDTVETCRAFEDAAVACVGPAGEAGVAYATIASDDANHHAGRGGAGTVMGDKRLKAIVAHDAPRDREDPAGLRERYEGAYRESATGQWLAASDLVETVEVADEIGALATRGWQAGVFEGAESVGVEAVRDRAVGREHGDMGGFRVETPNGEYVPRGASAMSLGAVLSIDDFDAVAHLGEVCDRLGMDLISAGNAVAWVMRASEKEALDRDLSFGDKEAARDLIEDIAYRRTRLGDALATGVDAASADLDIDVSIPSVKDMSAPAYDPRAARSMALAYATSDRGACHRRARPVEREAFDGHHWTDADRVEAVVTEQTVRAVLWSLVVDDFVGETLREDLGAEWLHAVGFDHNRDDLWTVGERVWTLVRLFNVREGMDRSDDSLPETFTKPLDGGPADGEAVSLDQFEDLLTQYYAAREWSMEGRPTRGLLERLDMTHLVDETVPVGDKPATPS